MDDHQLEGLLRAARSASGLTQQQVARALGVDQGTVSRWERGSMKPTDERKVDLARVLGRDARDLFPLAS